jgi:hypothetical protein
MRHGNTEIYHTIKNAWAAVLQNLNSSNARATLMVVNKISMGAPISIRSRVEHMGWIIFIDEGMGEVRLLC